MTIHPAMVLFVTAGAVALGPRATRSAVMVLGAVGALVAAATLSHGAHEFFLFLDGGRQLVELREIQALSVHLDFKRAISRFMLRIMDFEVSLVTDVNEAYFSRDERGL